MSVGFGWFLFILDLFLFVGGGIINKVWPTIGICMMVAGVVVLLILWRLDRR